MPKSDFKLAKTLLMGMPTKDIHSRSILTTVRRHERKSEA